MILIFSFTGTESERRAVSNAVSGHFKAQKYYKAVNAPATKDVFFKLIEIDNVIIGDAFSISLTIEVVNLFSNLYYSKFM